MTAIALAPAQDHTVDFTAHRHPSMAVACPVCRAGVGAWCKRPSGHRAWGHFHAERHQAADRLWYDGRYPSILAVDGGFAYDWCETSNSLAEWHGARLAFEKECSAVTSAAVSPAAAQLALPL